MLFLKASGMPIRRDSFGIVHCLDFRDLIRANRVAFVEQTRDRPRITDFAFDTFDYIENILRNRRNRYVHDLWGYDFQSEQVERHTYGPWIFKAQSRQPRDWLPFDIHAEDLDALWATVREVRDHSSIIQDLQDTFIPAFADRLERLLQSTPERRFLRPQAGTPNLPGSAGSEP